MRRRSSCSWRGRRRWTCTFPWTRAAPRSRARSVGASTASRSRSSWRRPGPPRSGWKSSRPGWTIGSGCSPAATGPRCRGTRRCGRRSTGATSCSPRSSAPSCTAWPSSPAASRWRRRAPSRRAPTSTRRRSWTASRTWWRSRSWSWRSRGPSHATDCSRRRGPTRSRSSPRAASSTGWPDATPNTFRDLFERAETELRDALHRRVAGRLRLADRQRADGAGLGVLPARRRVDRGGAYCRGGAAVVPAVAPGRVSRPRRARTGQPRAPTRAGTRAARCSSAPHSGCRSCTRRGRRPTPSRPGPPSSRSPSASPTPSISSARSGACGISTPAAASVAGRWRWRNASATGPPTPPIGPSASGWSALRCTTWETRRMRGSTSSACSVAMSTRFADRTPSAFNTTRRSRPT